MLGTEPITTLDESNDEPMNQPSSSSSSSSSSDLTNNNINNNNNNNNIIAATTSSTAEFDFKSPSREMTKVKKSVISTKSVSLFPSDHFGLLAIFK